MYRHFIFIVLLLQFGCSAFAQSIIWADTVINYSSQKSNKAFSADQVLGKPSKYPNPGHSTCAWSPDVSDLRKEEFIEVGFPVMAEPKQLYIIENYNPGFIKSVRITDIKGNSLQVYKREEIVTGGPGKLLNIPLEKSGLANPIRSVQLLMDQPTLYNTYQIDAIGISSSSGDPDLHIYEISDSLHYSAEHLNTGINTTSNEVYPVISPDGKTLYFDRQSYPENTGGQHLDDIWISHLNNGSWSVAENIKAPLNNDGVNFLCSISPDGNSALLGNIYGTGISGPGVSKSIRSGDEWQMPQQLKINGFSNQNENNEFCLAADGSTLIMTIETDESYGLLDLYVSFLQSDGSFSKPRHLGHEINTAGNEMTPFLAADGKTLYFSSNGFPGYGSQDIFMSRRLDDSWLHWSDPVNLGPSINTAEWEAYYTIDAEGKYAYFSSSYTVGTNLDIFRIQLPPAARPDNILWMRGKVTDKITGATLAATITAYSPGDSSITGISQSTLYSDYALILQQQELYNIRIEAPGYYLADTVLTLLTLSSESTIHHDFNLIPKRTGVIIEMNNIEFPVNSDVLESSSFSELNKVVAFLNENPGVEIEVRGHTNGLCDDNYCNSLSEKRAASVMNYFISKGIAPGRVTSHGYGKTIPIADNKTAEGRKRNQRVEFMITRSE